MFKNAIIYRLGAAWTASLEAVEAALDKSRYLPAGPSQEKSSGWVEPRGEAHGPLVESVAGQWILKFMIEVKVVPGSVLNRKAKERADQIEQTTGRKPGKKELKEIKEELRLTLLPMAFSKIGCVTGWFDPATGLLVLDTASQSAADAFVTELAKAVEGIKVALVGTQLSAGAVMASWLHDADKLDTDDRWGFEIGRACELWACDESKAKVRYQNHTLDTDEVREHIQQGKLPVKLELTYRDRVTATLTQAGSLQKIEFLDVAFEGQNPDDAGGFDADVAIMTGEMAPLLQALIEALGGEAERQEGGVA